MPVSGGLPPDVPASDMKITSLKERQKTLKRRSDRFVEGFSSPDTRHIFRRCTIKSISKAYKSMGC